MAVRPHRRLRVAELNRLFSRSAQDKAALRSILDELEYRKMPGAVDMKRRIRSPLGEPTLFPSRGGTAGALAQAVARRSERRRAIIAATLVVALVGGGATVMWPNATFWSP